MKKIIIALSMLLGVSVVSAQEGLFVGGEFALYGEDHELEFTLLPEVGYEISEEWAVGAEVGFTLTSKPKEDENHCVGTIRPFARYTPWQNELIHLDVKAVVGFSFDKDLQGSTIGLVPVISLTPTEHFEIEANLGLVGAQYNGAEDIWGGGIMMGSGNLSVGVAYKF